MWRGMAADDTAAAAESSLSCAPMSDAPPANLPLKQRPIDIFFMVMFSLFALTSAISDAIPTLGIPMTADSPSMLARSNFWYGNGCDPLFLLSPLWLRIVTGLSAFVYGPFYVLLVWALAKGKNGIQLPAVMYATLITVITGVLVFGVEFFGEPQYRVQNAPKFLAFNLPYVIVPLLLLVRMRKESPFLRRF
jgi:hypothetical protein